MVTLLWKFKSWPILGTTTSISMPIFCWNKKAGPAIHQCLLVSMLCLITLLQSTATFSSVGKNCQSWMLELFVISLAQCIMNCPKFTFSFWMYFKTVAESLHKCSLPIFSFSSSNTVTFNLEAKTAACSSSLGTVIVLLLMGAKLLLLITKLQQMLSAIAIWRYPTAPYMQYSRNLKKTCNSSVSRDEVYLHHLGISIVLKLSRVSFHFCHLRYLRVWDDPSKCSASKDLAWYILVLLRLG